LKSRKSDGFLIENALLVKTEVQFHTTSFNCSDPKDYFINACCFGDDAARWLIQQLRAQGLRTDDEPGQEDFGWFFNFQIGEVKHCFVIGFQPNDRATGDRWLGSVEHHAGFWKSLFGGRKRGVLPEAIQAIDKALQSNQEIRRIVWNETGHDPGEAESKAAG
jgi:hypothetical protein